METAIYLCIGFITLYWFVALKIEAQLAPPLMTDSFNYFLPLAFNAVGREEVRRLSVTSYLIGDVC